MTIEIPEDLASRLAEIAAAEHKTLQQVAVEQLSSFQDQRSSANQLLQSLRGLPRPSAAAVDELEAAIASSRLPVQDRGAFD